MGALQYTYPLSLPAESLQGLSAALTKNNRDFQAFLNSTVIRKEGSGIVALPGSSTVGGVAISTVARLNDLTDVVTTLPTTKHFLAHNGAGQFVNRVIVEADIFDLHAVPSVAITGFDAEPSRTSVSHYHGDMEKIADAQALDAVPTDLVVTLGISKVLVVINAGSDVAGSILVTGTSVDRDTGAETGSDTDVLTVDTLSTDSSTTDANGNVVHEIVDGYLTTKWFTGTVTLSTTDLTLTDVDVYLITFEQWNDTPAFEVDTLDVTVTALNVAAEFDAYLFTVIPTGDKVVISALASIHIGAVGSVAVADRGYRLRRGNLGQVMDGSKDGLFVSVMFANSPSYMEDMTLKVWCKAV